MGSKNEKERRKRDFLRNDVKLGKQKKRCLDSLLAVEVSDGDRQ